MSMSKKDFVALADALRPFLAMTPEHTKYTYLAAEAKDGDAILDCLVRFCAQQNPRFNRERWLAYLRGECGTNGGKR